MVRLYLLLIFGGLFSAFPGLAAERVGNASAAISRIITIAETSTLNFGTIAISPLAGNVTLDPAGQTSTTIPSAQVTGAFAPAEFSVSGDPSSVLSISFSSGDTLTGPGAPLVLFNFLHDAGGTPTLNTGGALVFKVGASLAVGPNQPTGSYAGQYTVTINYN